MPGKLMDRKRIAQMVQRTVGQQLIIDMHTHVYPPSFGTPNGGATANSDPTGLLLWGIDELLTYHYLVAEVFRVVPATSLPYEIFWKLSKQQQADHIWKYLFIERSPVSEACRGVLTTLQMLGLDPGQRSLAKYRKWFAGQKPGDYIDKVMELSHVESITMTNAVFDDNERGRWLADRNVGDDPRFQAVLRIDPMLRDWPRAAKRLTQWGFRASQRLDQQSINEAKRFLSHWLDYQKAIYIAVSLPPEFRYPADANDPVARAGQTMLQEVILPVCADRALPFAMMIGSKMRVNPALGDAGDMVGRSDVSSVVNLCREFPRNKFLVTMLARENQHELCVAARKFGNLMIFGCWWFLNNPSLIEEMTRMRLELLGTSFIPQHSDARVLDHLIYKWEHSRKILVKVLTDKYADMAQAGWKFTPAELKRDVDLLFRQNFLDFLKR